MKTETLVSHSVALQGGVDAQSASTPILLRLLLVDDDEEEFLIIRSLLRESAQTPGAQQFSVEWVAEVNEALASIESGGHDAYLIDYRLGDVTGLELIERAVSLGCEAPLILLSGLDDPRVDSDAMRVGATDYLVKDQLTGALLERALRYAIAGKRSERELRAVAVQNARLQAAIEAASVGVALTQERGNENFITYVNPAFTRMTGYEPSEAIGQTLNLTRGRENAPDMVEELREKLRNGEACNGTALNFRRDGSAFWNEAHFAPITVASGERFGHVGFFQDVTARVEAEQTARRARQDLENAQTLTHLGSWSQEVAPDGTISSFWSDECYRILGLEPQVTDVEARCESWIERVHPDEREAARAISRQATTGETPVSFECRVVRPGGEERHVQLRAHRESEPGENSPLRIVGTLLDVTERVRAERAEREMEDRLQAVTQSAPIILWAIDCEGIFTLSEGHILRRLGLEPGAVVGQSVFEVYAEEPEVCEMCRRVLRGEECQQIMSMLGRSFAVYVGPKWNAQGEQVGAVGISYDVTEQYQAQQALRENEARFERIMPGVPGMVYSVERSAGGVGLDDRFIYVSEGCEEIFGVAPSAVIESASNLIGTFDEDDVELLDKTLAESARDLTSWTLEFCITRPDGERRRVRAQSRPARTASGSTVWDGVMIDLTESQRAQQALVQSRRALDEAQRLAHIGSFTWHLRTGESRWSDEMYRILEVEIGTPIPSPDEILSRYHPDDRAMMTEDMQTLGAEYGKIGRQVRLIRRDGSVRYIETRSSVQHGDDGQPRIMTGSLQDVTERVEAERALRESEERYALAMRGTNDGLWDWNLITDEVYYSPHWKAMLGHEEDDIGTTADEWLGRVHPDDIEIVRAQMKAHTSGQNAQCECEYRLRNARGEYQWMLGRGLALFGEDGIATRLSGSQTDISKRKRAESQLEHNAFYDSLTNLPNRALFSERLDRTITRGNRHPEQTFAVLFLDIDRFKKINDSLGHLPGDRLLIEASARFARCLRPGDTVARLGGDEFAILLDDLSGVEDVHQVADRIHAELGAPFDLDGHEAFVTVSMGIALGQGDEVSADELLRSADIAMYRAKGAGRGRHEVFEATMHARAVKMLEMETDLWRALERDELRLHYQPIIDLKSGKVVGFEALVRWQHPERGLVSPGDFIPLAEESGLIVPIGWWVLEEACRQAKLWQGEFGDLWMSVNLSPKQLSQPDILERVSGALERTGFSGSLLKLEITESVIMENTESAAQMLRDIKALGVRFSMDDFGTGYSSLSYLHRFPLDTIKIDRSFVSQMKPGARDHEIVNTIISMSRGLKMHVVAEGVETPEQLKSLREMRCGFAQGFYMSRPQPHEQIEELLQRGLSW